MRIRSSGSSGNSPVTVTSRPVLVSVATYWLGMGSAAARSLVARMVAREEAGGCSLPGGGARIRARAR